jgi:IS5 family transposase
MRFPAVPFAAAPTLLLTAPNSDLLLFLSEAHRLIVAEPSLLAAVDRDLDAHGKSKKALRIADARWAQEQSRALPGFSSQTTVLDPQTLILLPGRPRTSAYVVLMFLLLRGYAGGFKRNDVTTLAQESVTLMIFFHNMGCKMPGSSTLTELVNAVSNDTRAGVLDAQVRQILRAKWDDFGVMLQDSTAVAGNSEWPTDSKTMVTLVERILRVGAGLDRVGLPVLRARGVADLHVGMAAIARTMELDPGKTKTRARTRKRRYKKLLDLASKVYARLDCELMLLAATCATLDLCPSRRVVAERAVKRLRDDHEALAKVIEACTRRVMLNEKVSVGDKVLSTSDPDVGFIAKGQRDPVIGYKPQLARSGAGFITGILVPRGNASDSEQFAPMFRDVQRRTGVTPRVVSLDDGYASAANVTLMRDEGVEVMSINGSKGKKLTTKRDWESEAYEEARDLRSAIESLMFTMKQGFDFGEVARRGLERVEGELLEKVLAYNLCRIALARTAAVESARAAAAESDDALAA